MQQSTRLLFAIALCAPAPALAQESTFTVGNEKYSIKRFPAKPAAAKRPVVVIAHGTDGLSGQSGVEIEKLAKELADAGFLAFVPHYFDKNDGADSLESFQQRVGNFNRYLPRIAGALEFAAKQPDAGDQVGLVGFSLGGGLVLTYAQSAAAGKIKAVVDFYGYIPDGGVYQNAAKLPPTLVLHNKRDLIVNVKYSEDLIKALRGKGVQHERQFYDEEYPQRGNHPFRPAGAADLESRKRTVNWLTKHLK